MKLTSPKLFVVVLGLSMAASIAVYFSSVMPKEIEEDIVQLEKNKQESGHVTSASFPPVRPVTQATGIDSSGKVSKKDKIFRRNVLPSKIKRPLVAFDRDQASHRKQRSKNKISSNRINGLFPFGRVKSGSGASGMVNDLKSLGGLNDQEVESAFQAIREGNADGALRAESWNWVVDQLMGAMREDGGNVIASSRRLADLYKDQTLPITTRDYALQHLGHLFNEGNGDMELIRESMVSGLNEKQGTMAGTALLALSHNGEGRVLQTLGQPALGIAQDITYSVESRATALQIAESNGESGVQDYSKTLLSITETSTFLRRSAESVIERQSVQTGQ